MQGRSVGTAGLVDDMARWRAAVPTRALPYHRLFELVAELWSEDSLEAKELRRRLGQAWKARDFGVFYERPLLFVAALRMEALKHGRAHPLWGALAASEPDPSDVTRGALLEALADESVWTSLRERFVQTNETSRAVAWLWPARLIGCDGGRRPLALVEVGAAAGLNLVADRTAATWSTTSGSALPTARSLRTTTRLGIDARPLDVCDDIEATWLRACVWAGEHERLTRLDAAIEAFRASPTPVEPGDVTEVPDRLRALSSGAPSDGVVLAFQTIVRDYLPDDTREAYEGGMRRWLERAPVGSAAWVELEIDHGAEPAHRVPLVAHARDADRCVDIVLGRTGYHPTSVTPDDAAVAYLERLFRRRPGALPGGEES